MSSQHASSRRSPRAALIVGSVVAVWLLLAVRLAQLQGFHREEFSERALGQLVFDEPIRARPGEILDRSGRLLATSLDSSSLFADPAHIDDPDTFATRVAGVLDLDADVLAERIREAKDRRFLWVKRRLSQDEVVAIRELGLPAESWGFRNEFRRYYPQGRLAAHVVGLRGIDNVGRGGVEEQFDERLRGKDGIRTLVRDARGYVLDVLEEVTRPPRHGARVVLTLDSVIQLYVEQQLDVVMDEWKPLSASAIVVDPASGDILAMASRPTYDPNHPAEIPDDAWRNAAVSDVYEPGSTIKPFVVSWALQGGLVQRDEQIDCEYGVYRMGRRILHDHHSYGMLSLVDVLAKSSNIGMAKIGERLTNRGLHEALTAFGFGRPVGVELPGEVAGTLRPLREWNGYSTGSIPMGHELGATPLQVISAYAILANGGTMVSPHLLLITDEDETSQYVVVAPVVSEKTARWMVSEPMVEVVRRGTGRRAQLDGYTVFGKTGTAQKIDPETGGYSHDRHFCSFVGGAPADDPRVLVIVTVNEPTVGSNHGGGSVAAPAAAEILRRTLIYLRVPME
ncbi:MAG: peptidoglycan D,D-transpeptidase FtsI family protein [Maioricimonas sp. JB045]